jgi:Zn-finger domain-containing protein
MSDIDELKERMEKLQTYQDKNIDGVDELLRSTDEFLKKRQEGLDSVNDEYMRRKEEEKRAILERMKHSNDSLDDALSSYNEIGRGR